MTLRRMCCRDTMRDYWTHVRTMTPRISFGVVSERGRHNRPQLTKFWQVSTHVRPVLATFVQPRPHMNPKSPDLGQICRTSVAGAWISALDGAGSSFEHLPGVISHVFVWQPGKGSVILRAHSSSILVRDTRHESAEYLLSICSERVTQRADIE